MILFALAAILIFLAFYNFKAAVFSLPLFFVFFDMFDGFYKDDKIFAALRYFIPLALLLLYIIRHNALKNYDFVLVALIAYLGVLWIINSGDSLASTRNLLAIVITLLMIPLGKHFAQTTDFLKGFEKYNRVLLMTLPAYVVYANIFKIGESYTEAFSTGYLITSRIYIIPIVVFLAIHYFLTNKDKTLLVKINDAVFMIINVCILLINTRRTALGMLFGALFVYALLNRRLIFKMVGLTVFMVAALIFSYPLYEARLTAQLEKRDRIQNLDTYEEEGRVLETLYIMDYHEKTGSLLEVLFGVKFFDTDEFGTRYFGRDRPIHSDLNMIFFSTGLFGFFLFAYCVVHYFFMGNHRIEKQAKVVYYPLLIMFLLVLLPGRFIGTLTFAPLLMLLLASIKFGIQSSPVPEPAEEIPLPREHNFFRVTPPPIKELLPKP
ncbi:hypothetical protein [Rufibacter radiotolerans]|uniref:hypothetical protein n=1 Tax=Rufibacter radiotolerans TaxID=1379910 RepID=UPI0006645A31|nr:hypothetical protein [Rufibacter radiotolerans]